MRTSSNTIDEKVGVIGLGKLGFPLAVILGQMYDVVGVDKHSIPMPNEPHFDELHKSANIELTRDYSKLKGASKIFCVVPTPSIEPYRGFSIPGDVPGENMQGTFTNKYVRQAIEEAKPHMDDDTLFNIVSTTMPGSCKKLKDQYNMRLTYNPEFIALGNVVEGMLNPDLVLIGEDNPVDGDELQQVYENVFDFASDFLHINEYPREHRPPIKRMDLTSAELAKLALNTYITQKVTFANVVGEVADKVGADAESVLDAIGADTRIGKKYFKPYGAYGGPCFPRDTVAFSKMAGEVPNFAAQTDTINKHIAKKYGYHDKREEYKNA